MDRFEVVFFEEAIAEYHALDGSERKYVDKALTRIAENGDVIGDPLESKRGLNLTGCRRVKLLKQGIRIVYRLKDGEIEIVEIVAIGKRADEEVYKDAFRRLM